MFAGLSGYMLAAATLPGLPLADSELAAMRGGFRLPGGIEVALTVRSDTSVDGALLLRSVFSVVNGAPLLQVLAPAKGGEAPTIGPNEASVARAGDAAAAGSNALSVQFDRQNGVVFVPGATAVAPTINVTSGARADVDDAGLVLLAAGPAPIETAGGQVTVSALPEGMRVRLEGAGLDVSHLVGAAFGSVIANTASDRTIDTTTTIGLDLGNVRPDLIGSSMFRVENVAVEAARLGLR
ncbi:MAG: hypothetical protein JWM38_1102 [Sphingomonas bacterium]|nr:hypothetical protein [Sphingomonas bacterium]